MEKLFKIIILSTLALLLISSCTINTDPKNIVKKIDFIKEITPVTNNQVTDFDLFFLKENESFNNKVYSPLSIKYGLGMLLAGSDGDTKEQITKILGNYGYPQYQNSNNLSIANALFIKDNYKDKLNSNFKNELKQKFNTEILIDNMNNANNINQWISNKTLNMIKNPLKDNDVHNMTLGLINTLTIDMEWAKKFHPDVNGIDRYYPNFFGEKIPIRNIEIHYEQIEPTLFNDKEINTRKYQFQAIANKYDIVKEIGETNLLKIVKNNSENMSDNELREYLKKIKNNYGQFHISTDFSYYTNDDIKIFAKDLKEYNNSQFQFVAIMPKKQKLNPFITKLNANDINSWLKQLTIVNKDNCDEGVVTVIDGYIPGFDFQFDLDLATNLQQLGIQDIFNPEKADLSKMSNDKDNPLFVNGIKHITNINLTNKGIKAASATIVSANATAPKPQYEFDVPIKMIDLKFDHSYMFLIRDKKTSEVLFVGSVLEPSIKK